MKKFIICVLIILILVIPIPISPAKDGGTRQYVALTYKIVVWHSLYDDDKILDKTKIYFFPDNFCSINELRNREINN